MTTADPAFSVHVLAPDEDLADAHAVRDVVFIEEQQVPAGLERDGMDAFCVQVLARDAAGTPIGTGRMLPPLLDAGARVGRMAVLGAWRGRGVGAAMLEALIAAARERGWPAVDLHAQVDAFDFYVRHGFVPVGARFEEAGIIHQGMHRRLGGATAIETRAAAQAITTALVLRARRTLYIYSREMDPGLFDAPPVLDALRALAVSRSGAEIRIVLHRADAPQRAHAPLISLAQRLPSVFQFREVVDQVDRDYPSAFVVNDAHGWYFRSLGHRFDGEADIDDGARARQLIEAFRPVWERARPVGEYRALGI